MKLTLLATIAALSFPGFGYAKKTMPRKPSSAGTVSYACDVSKAGVNSLADLGRLASKEISIDAPLKAVEIFSNGEMTIFAQVPGGGQSEPGVQEVPNFSLTVRNLKSRKNISSTTSAGNILTLDTPDFSVSCVPR